MAVKSDDMDIRPSWLYTEVGGNGDYYITVVEEKYDAVHDKPLNVICSIRVTTSGSRYPPEVALAVANLYRVLEANGLNEREFKKG